MKIPLNEFTKRASLVKKSDRYEVYDLALENLALSMTVLHRDKSTTGHSHDDTDEIYLFIEGNGKIQLDNEIQDIVSGDIVTMPRKVFHRVFNAGDGDLTFYAFLKNTRTNDVIWHEGTYPLWRQGHKAKASHQHYSKAAFACCQ